jgi:RimJ/RimL family protein N-acetyltransferase
MTTRILQSDEPLQGDFVRLSKFQKEHIPSLWKHLDLGNHPELMEYMPWPSPQSEAQLWEICDDLQSTPNTALFAIQCDPRRVNHRFQPPNASPPPVTLETLGFVAYLDIQPHHRAVEIGAVLLSPCLRRSSAATETQFLLLKHALDIDPVAASVPYRRVVWKCDSKNLKSVRTAERLGYRYEGTFRNHMLVNGRSRDSDWFSIIDGDWSIVRHALVQWLKEDNFGADGTQIDTLGDLRAAGMAGDR